MHIGHWVVETSVQGKLVFKTLVYFLILVDLDYDKHGKLRSLSEGRFNQHFSAHALNNPLTDVKA